MWDWVKLNGMYVDVHGNERVSPSEMSCVYGQQ